MAPAEETPGPSSASTTAAGSFSWKLLLADRLQDQSSSSSKGGSGKEVFVDTDEALKGKHVALYFSAHWCPPCRAFTPKLAHTYSKLQKDGKAWEVVFVSMDRNPQQFEEYFSTMPWLAVPFKDDQLRSVLTRKFNVQGVPQLVMLAPDSTVLCQNARGAVDNDPTGESFPWEGAVQQPKGLPIPWMLLAFLVYWLVNLYLFPPKPKAAAEEAAGQQ